MTVIYIESVKPFAEPSTNRNEVINECFLIGSSINLQLFFYRIDSQELRYSIGWFYIAIQALIYSVNITRMGIHLIMNVIPLLYNNFIQKIDTYSFKSKRKLWFLELKQEFE
jgi:hypothetical protein